MAVDYLSTLNSKGSGINISQLVDSIVSAEIDPQKNIVKAKLDKGNVAISEMATIRSELATFSEVLNSPNAGLAIYADSTDDYVQISVDDPDNFTPFSSKVSVNQLAAEQVLAFTSISDTDITSTTDELNGGAAETFTISFGTWSSTGFSANSDATDLTLEMEAGATIADLVAGLSDLDGVTARLIDNGDDTYTLAVISASGEENAIYISSSSGDFDTVASDADGLPSQQLSAATDAELEVDGITVTRTSNEITDLFDGTTLTISGVTTSYATVSALEDSSIALAEMNAFIGYINANRSMLNIATARGINGSTPGPFAGDITMNSIKSQLSAITTNPIEGFSSGSFYLSDIGVYTNQDGTLSLDADQFTTAFDEDSSKYSAVFRSKIEADSNLFSATATDFSNLTAGTYDVTYDSSNDELTVDDETFVTFVSSDSYTNYYSSSGDFSGVSLKSSTGVGADTTLYVGISLISTISDYLDDLLSSSGDFTARETTIEEDIADYEIKIASFDEKAIATQSRYMSQFVAMEQMVTRFKSTGDYLTTMMDAWSNQK
jgi:flagellar hook-associated protein 2